MRTLAIILGDNDFGNTFQQLLETVKRVMNWKLHSLQEDQIRLLIQEGIHFHVLAFQPPMDMSNIEDTVRYLKGNVKILFDDEAEEDISTKDHDHGAWYLELITGKIYSY